MSVPPCHYWIVTEVDVGERSETVSRLVIEGWIPIGGVILSERDGMPNYQTMWKPMDRTYET